jgi:hypothetical protein
LQAHASTMDHLLRGPRAHCHDVGKEQNFFL